MSKTFKFQLNRLYKYTCWTSVRNTPFLFCPAIVGRLPPPLSTPVYSASSRRPKYRVQCTQYSTNINTRANNLSIWFIRCVGLLTTFRLYLNKKNPVASSSARISSRAKLKTFSDKFSTRTRNETIR